MSERDIVIGGGMSMRDEEFIREYVLKILKEQAEEKDDKSDLPGTTGPGPGRYKKELANLKALSDSNPKKLMQNLGIKPGGGGQRWQIILKILNDAISGTKEMDAVYNNTQKKKDAFGRMGIAVSLTGELAVRDALAFIREAFRGAKNAGYLNFDDKVQVEILGNEILAYVSPKAFRWNQKLKKSKKSKPEESKPEESKPEESKPEES